MQKKYWIYFLFAGIVLSADFLLSGKAKSPAPEKNNTACCKIKMQDCLEKQKTKNVQGEMIMENLSRQFLLITPF